MRVCECVCVCARARVCMCVGGCDEHTYVHCVQHVFVYVINVRYAMNVLFVIECGYFPYLLPEIVGTIIGV